MSNIFEYYPQIEYEFSAYWSVYAEITVDHLVLPYNTMDYSILGSTSIFALLFDNSYSDTTYQYMFKVVEKSTLDTAIREKISMSYNTVRPYISCETTDTGALNIFSFTPSDIVMFDLLLLYRMGTTPILTTIIFENLSNISKLIYSYLQLMINNNFDYINDTDIISEDDNLLETLYEVYVTNESHRTIRNWSFIADNEIIYTMPYRDNNTLDASDISSGYYYLSRRPYSLDPLYLFRNGDLQDSDTYVIQTITDTTGGCNGQFAVDWRTTTLSPDTDDVILVDYYILNNDGNAPLISDTNLNITDFVDISLLNELRDRLDSLQEIAIVKINTIFDRDGMLPYDNEDVTDVVVIDAHNILFDNNPDLCDDLNFINVGHIEEDTVEYEEVLNSKINTVFDEKSTITFDDAMVTDGYTLNVNDIFSEHEDDNLSDDLTFVEIKQDEEDSLDLEEDALTISTGEIFVEKGPFPFDDAIVTDSLDVYVHDSTTGLLVSPDDWYSWPGCI